MGEWGLHKLPKHSSRSSIKGVLELQICWLPLWITQLQAGLGCERNISLLGEEIKSYRRQGVRKMRKNGREEAHYVRKEQIKGMKNTSFLISTY